MTDTNDSFFKRRWKLILNIITILALFALLYVIRDQLSQTLTNLSRVWLGVLVLMLPIQLLNYHAQTKMYQHLFQILGNKLSYKFLFRTSLELNMVNSVFPSGGVSGVSYYGVRMRDGGKVTGAKATLVQVMKVALLILSFELLLIVGLFLMAIEGRASGLILFVTGSLSTLLIVGTLGSMYIIGSKRRINSFFIAVTKFFNGAVRLFRPKNPETIDIQKAHGVFDDMHQNYMHFRRHYKKLKAPFYWALTANLSEIMTIYVVYIAFGEWVNIGAVILAYAVANFAGLVSVLPGGVGVYEFLMTAVLVAGGVPAAVSLPVTVMYRVLNTLIQVPPGYYFYHKTLQSSGAT